MRFLASKSIGLLLLSSLTASCGGAPQKAAVGTAAPAKDVTSAMAEMFPFNRSKVRGIIKLRATDQGVLLRGKLTGLVAGQYGFGVHEKGDCGLDGKSAGGYFEGGNKVAPLGHLDDLTIDKDKVDGLNVDRTEAHLKLSGPYSILGRTIAIEAWPTDPKVDPSTVPFVACGVIREE